MAELLLKIQHDSRIVLALKLKISELDCIEHCLEKSSKVSALLPDQATNFAKAILSSSSLLFCTEPVYTKDTL